MKRVQQGSFHVYSRGNKRNIVFYDRQDIQAFLSLCNRTAKKYDTALEEFVIMANHFHLHLTTTALSEFMRRLLHDYALWYNHRHGEKGKIFETPFGSAVKKSEERQIESKLYILQNPVKAGICKHPKEYLWNSYHFHYLSGHRTHLAKFIHVSTEQLDRYFYTPRHFENALIRQKILIGEVIKEDTNYWPKSPDSEIIKEFLKLLDGRNLYSLTRQELNHIIYTLFKETSANLRQIASVTHESYEFVRRICRSR